MRVLVACEFSGIVRDAFIARGHDAVSCDLLPSERPGPHIQGDVLKVLTQRWHMMIAFPPCTYLCRSGQHLYSNTIEMYDALRFVKILTIAPIPKIAIENPIGRISTFIRKPDQIVQPWMFGHPETKATCLWLKGLPKLEPTNVVGGRANRIANMPQSPTRSKDRSRTYVGLALAMSEQWG